MIELLTSPSVATLIAALAFAVRGVPRILEARAKAAEARARTAQARAEQEAAEAQAHESAVAGLRVLLGEMTAEASSQRERAEKAEAALRDLQRVAGKVRES